MFFCHFYSKLHSLNMYCTCGESRPSFWQGNYFKNGSPTYFCYHKKIEKNAIVWSKKGNRRVLCVFLMCTGKVPKEWKRPNDSPRVIWTRLVGKYLTQCCILLNDCRAIAVSWPEHIDVLDCMHLPHKIALERFACALYLLVLFNVWLLPLREREQAEH